MKGPHSRPAHERNPWGYPDEVWRRFCEAPGAGTLDGAGVLRARVEDRARGAVLELQVATSGSAQARFRALGCPATIAVGSWLAEALSGRPPARWQELDAAAIRAGLALPEDRAHCALLGEDLVRKLAHEWGAVGAKLGAWASN